MYHISCLRYRWIIAYLVIVFVILFFFLLILLRCVVTTVILQVDAEHFGESDRSQDADNRSQGQHQTDHHARKVNSTDGIEDD